MKGDVVFVPAGTIHALGAGLVVAEIQQSSDVTFRLFDYGRQRELHVENAVAVAHAAPPDPQVIAKRLTDRRTLLVACPYFVLERIELPPDTRCEIDVTEETWLLVLEGAGRVGRMNAAVGDAFFLEADHAAIVTGSVGLTCLVAYAAAAPLPDLLSVHSSTQLMEARS
jgi:mannose-6-phosphate isomerase